MPRKYSLLFSEMRKNILLKFICCNVLTFLKVLVSVWVECWVFFFYFIPFFFLLINVLFQVLFLATSIYKFRFALWIRYSCTQQIESKLSLFSLAISFACFVWLNQIALFSPYIYKVKGYDVVFPPITLQM